MKKVTLFLAALLLILLAVAFYVYRFVGSDTTFGLTDSSCVTRIRIAADSSKVTLIKKDDSWYLSDGNPTRSVADDALYALSLLQVKSPLPQSAAEEYNAAMNEAVSVSLGGRFMNKRSYKLCRLKDLGLVGVLHGKKTPYLLEVRGNSELDVLDMLSTNSLYWRQDVVFSFTPAEIRTVAVENIIEPQQSFVLQVDTLGQVKLTDTYLGKEITPVVAEKVKKYLSYFTQVGFEHYVTDLSPLEVESILLSGFAYMITVEDIYDNRQSVKLFLLPTDDALDAFGRPTQVDLNRCCIQINDEPQLALALWVDLDILLPSFDYFMNK
jgi:hypothetical protein